MLQGELKVRVEKPEIDTCWLDGQRRAGIPRVKRVNGRLYAMALNRMLLERRRSGCWVELPGLERPMERLDEKVMPLDFGFQDMDAFGPSDIYQRPPAWAGGFCVLLWRSTGQGVPPRSAAAPVWPKKRSPAPTDGAMAVVAVESGALQQRITYTSIRKYWICN